MNDPVAISPAEAFGEGTPSQEPSQAPQQQPVQQEPQGTPGQPEGGRQPSWAGGGFQRTEGAPAQAPAQPAAPQITPEMIQMAVQQGAMAAAQAVQQQRPAEPPRPPTPEEQAEFDRQFGVVRLNAEQYKAIMGVAPQNDAQVKALEQTLHATARQATLMAEFRAQQTFDKRLQEMQKTIDQRVAPAMDFYTQQRHAAIEQQFLGQNTDLKDHAALVREVAIATNAQVQAGQLRFSNQAEAFKFVADKARSLLGKAPPSGSPPARQAQTRRTMTPTSLGGSPGSGRPPQPANTGVISPQEVFRDN